VGLGGVPPTERLDGKWEKNHLPMTDIKRLSQFFLQSVFQGMAGMLCGPLDEGVLKGTDDCHIVIEGVVLTPHLMPDVDVGGAAFNPRDDAPLLG
jgi:hypothetical protein